MACDAPGPISSNLESCLLEENIVTSRSAAKVVAYWFLENYLNEIKTVVDDWDDPIVRFRCLLAKQGIILDQDILGRAVRDFYHQISKVKSEEEATVLYNWLKQFPSLVQNVKLRVVQEFC